MSKLHQLNRLLKRFNFSRKDLVEFEDHIVHTLKNFPASKMKIQKGRAIYRCRKYNLPLESLFCFESDLSYRIDLSNISDFGRCNVAENSVFYGSTYSPIKKNGVEEKLEMKDPGYVTAILETTSLVDSPRSTKVSEGVEIYGVGMWEATEDFDVFIMPPNKLWGKESELAKHLLEIHEKNMKYVSASDEIREFYNIMGSEFSKYMHDRPKAEYGISALFSSHTVVSGGGVIYSSVKQEHNGLNIALTPDTIDNKFKFKRAGIAELWKFGKDSHLRFTEVAERNHGIPLVYKKVKDFDFSVEKMIYYFENKGIDPNHIIKVLIESNYLII
jgi:hypothetical protein